MQTPIVYQLEGTEGTSSGLLRFLCSLLFMISFVAIAQGESYLKAEFIDSHVLHLNWPGLGTGTVTVEMATNLAAGFQSSVARDLPSDDSLNTLTLDVSGISQGFFRMNVASHTPPRNLLENFEDSPTLCA